MIGRQERNKDLFVNTLRDQTAKESYQYEHSKGRLYRGSSWKQEDKGPKEMGVTASNARYSNHQRR